MTTCPTCHGKDGLHGLDCGFASVRPHMTHHDDCGCLTARYQARIAELEAENEELRSRRLPCREAEIAQKRYEDAEAEASRAWGERDRYLKKLQECNTQLQQAEATIERLKAENERLRIALGDISTNGDGSECSRIAEEALESGR